MNFGGTQTFTLQRYLTAVSEDYSLFPFRVSFTRGFPAVEWHLGISKRNCLGFTRECVARMSQVKWLLLVPGILSPCTGAAHPAWTQSQWHLVWMCVWKPGIRNNVDSGREKVWNVQSQKLACGTSFQWGDLARRGAGSYQSPVKMQILSYQIR